MNESLSDVPKLPLNNTFDPSGASVLGTGTMTDVYGGRPPLTDTQIQGKIERARAMSGGMSSAVSTGTHNSFDESVFQYMTTRNKTPKDNAIIADIYKEKYKKLDYVDVEREVDQHYLNLNHKYSSSLDILASYLKGQKIIYMQSKIYCERQLNYLMLPALMLSALATVMAGIGDNLNSTGKPWTIATISFDYRVILAIVNAVIGFLLAIVNYLKLDASQEAHKISSRQYDKLQSSVEFTSGSILLFSSELSSGDRETYEEQLRIKLRDVENKIGEIKDTNQFLTPYAVRCDFPIMYNINVFSLIKKIEDYRKKTITSLKNVKNEIGFIQFIQERQDYELETDYKNRLVFLFKLKKDLINEILILQSAYSMIDTMFLQEMKNAQIKDRRCLRGCKGCCEDRIVEPDKLNPFISKLIDPFKRNETQTTKRQLCCFVKETVVKSQPDCNDCSDSKMWFRSDENHCKDGDCAVNFTKKKASVHTQTTQDSGADAVAGVGGGAGGGDAVAGAVDAVGDVELTEVNTVIEPGEMV